MKNLALCKTYYYEIIKPWIVENYPLLSDKIASGVFNYDDKELSNEDGLDWKSRFYIWLTKEDYKTYAGELIYKLQEKQLLPEAADMNIIVTTVDCFVKLWFDVDQEQISSSISNELWTKLSEQKLSVFSCGVILEDPIGKITEIQEQLRYYPEEVRRQFLEEDWTKANEIWKVYHCHCRGNRIGEKVALNHVMETLIHITYLYNKRYDPGESGVNSYQLRDLNVVGKEIESWMIRCYNSAFIDEIMICFQSMIEILMKEDKTQQIGSYMKFSVPICGKILA